MATSISTIKRTLGMYMRENTRRPAYFYGTTFLWLAGIMLQRLVLPLITVHAFNQIVTAEASNDLHFSLFTKDIVLFVIVGAISQVCIDTSLVITSKLETSVIARLYNRVYNHLLQQSMQFHNNSFSGALVNQTNRFVNGYVTITDTLIINVSQSVVLVFFSSIVLFFYSPLIGAAVLSWAIIFVLVNLTLTRRRIPFSKARAAADTQVTGYLADSVSNVSAIKTFAAEKYEAKQFAVQSRHRAHQGYLYWIRSIKNDGVFAAMMLALQLLVLVVSIVAVQHNAIQVGTLVLAQVYITQMIANLWGLSGLTKNVEQSLSDAAEMTEILSTPANVTDAPAAKPLHIKQPDIVFDSVTFTHAENRDRLFENLSFQIKPGEKVGLVGASGGGKTTVTKLLLRFMDIQDGTISIDGQDIAKVTQESLRAAIAYVPQEPILFHRSLAENISYGNSQATLAQIKKAARLAHADEFIEKLPNGYETMVGERGVKLSGGQRQRVAIARAMIKDAPILVLDEATSALDSESEVLIQDALWKLMEGRTAIVIAHRLSTIQKMDRIIVMDEGKIVEQGTHKELIKHGGIYSELWNHQTGGFIED